jgi:OOP family OmpA-OmpF porin
MHMPARIAALFLLFAVLIPAQSAISVATKDDWEEVNFEFNSAVLSDGFPSLLRLAELLNKNPDYRVRLDGHTDSIGSEKYNEKLSNKRGETVKNFLEKYGARGGDADGRPGPIRGGGRDSGRGESDAGGQREAGTDAGRDSEAAGQAGRDRAHDPEHQG